MHKRVAIAGFGLEGRSAADFLADAGAMVSVFDEKAESEFPIETLQNLRARGVSFYFGSFGPFTGFDAIVRSPGVPPHLSALEVARKEGIPVTSATKIFFELCPCPVVGVTGTKGKGTTSSLIHQMLLAAGMDAYLCGNIGIPALDVLGALAEDSVVVFELSSFQLIEMDRSPQTAVVLMVTSDHLDFHRTDGAYVAAKGNILRFQKPEDRAVVNIDYPASREIAKLGQGEMFEVSRRAAVAKGAYVAGDALMLATDGAPHMLIRLSDIPLAGAHNIENIGAAALAASLHRAPDDAIVKAIRSFKALPHRLELVREVAGVRYYDDSISTTPESALAAMRAFSEPKVMLLGGSSKGADWSECAAALAADPSVKAIVGLGEEWLRIREALAPHLKEGSWIKVFENINSMAAAVQAAAAAAAAGDVVMLSPGCASFGMFKNYQDRGEQFAAAVRTL